MGNRERYMPESSAEVKKSPKTSGVVSFRETRPQKLGKLLRGEVDSEDGFVQGIWDSQGKWWIEYPKVLKAHPLLHSTNGELINLTGAVLKPFKDGIVFVALKSFLNEGEDYTYDIILTEKNLSEEDILNKKEAILKKVDLSAMSRMSGEELAKSLEQGYRNCVSWPENPTKDPVCLPPF